MEITEIVDATQRDLEPDLRSILHEEIERLPERERLPVVLCHLEGITHEQAAARLGWTVPTVGYRLTKARKRLRDRLTRRGITATSVGVIMASATTTAMAALPASWARAAVAMATGGPTPATVAALTQTILIRGMLMTQLKIAAAAVLAAAGFVCVGVVSLGEARQRDQGHPPRARRPSPINGQPRPKHERRPRTSPCRSPYPVL